MTADKSKKEISYLPRSWGAASRKSKKEKTDKVPPVDKGIDDSEKALGTTPDGSSAISHTGESGTEKEMSSCENGAGTSPVDEAECHERPCEFEDTEECCSAELLDQFESCEEELDEGPADWLDDLQEIPRLRNERGAFLDFQPVTSETEPQEKVTVRVVGVRFSYASRIYHFEAPEQEVTVGDWVVVKTEKGLGLGRVVFPPLDREIEVTHLESLRKVIRKATKADLEQKARCFRREAEAYEFCLKAIEDLNLPMKLVGTECFFDGSKYVFYFTAEGRVDFRELVKVLVSRFPVRIEMRQIGVRHEAKMLGGLGCCGQELCCSRFLTDFRPVSVKMAKVQNLSLNPTKISGVCGRLMCCLAYEYETYEAFKKGLPKVGKVINTPHGEGVVMKHDPLSERVHVRLADDSVVAVERSELLALEEKSVTKKHGSKKSCEHLSE